MSLEKAVYPDTLKRATVIPLYLAGIKSNMNNYRSISLISNTAKIFKKVLYSRIYEFLTKNNRIFKRQLGFLKGRETTDALGMMSDIIYENLDKCKPTIVTFLDLTKAFDMVDHKILLCKL